MTEESAPGVERIADIIWRARFNSDCGGRAAQEIADLFAPILAEKERRVAEWQVEVRREGDRFKGDIDDLNAECDRLHARALAAEAELAGERERAEQMFATVRKAHVAMTMACALPGVASEYDFSEAIASTEAALARRAAAIRTGE